jgi:hypothetical protein
MAESKKETVRAVFPQKREIMPGFQSAGLRQGTAPISQSSRVVPPSDADTASSHRPRGLSSSVIASPIAPPLPARPAVVQTSPIVVTATRERFDSIPRWFCWGLLCISALIFLIQVWNYALS